MGDFPSHDAPETEDYRRGYTDGREDLMDELAAVLRIEAVSVTASEEPLTDAQVRRIFAGVFGVKATDDEFGAPPSGRGVRDALAQSAGQDRVRTLMPHGV